MQAQNSKDKPNSGIGRNLNSELFP